MSKTKFLSFAFAVSSLVALAQQPATSAETVKAALAQKQKMTETSLVKNVPFKNIGPHNGRIVR